MQGGGWCGGVVEPQALGGNMSTLSDVTTKCDFSVEAILSSWVGIRINDGLFMLYCELVNPVE